MYLVMQYRIDSLNLGTPNVHSIPLLLMYRTQFNVLNSCTIKYHGNVDSWSEWWSNCRLTTCTPNRTGPGDCHGQRTLDICRVAIYQLAVKYDRRNNRDFRLCVYIPTHFRHVRQAVLYLKFRRDWTIFLFLKPHARRPLSFAIYFWLIINYSFTGLMYIV